MQLVVMVIVFEMMDHLLPVGCQDVLVRAVEALVHVGPRTRVKLGGRVAGTGQLEKHMVSQGPGATAYEKGSGGRDMG